MVVGDDEVDSERRGLLSLGEVRDAAVARHHERRTTVVHVRNAGGAEAVTFSDAVRDVLHRSRAEEALPALKLEAAGRELRLSFPRGWLTLHPLTWADLRQEKDFLDALGIPPETRLGADGFTRPASVGQPIKALFA